MSCALVPTGSLKPSAYNPRTADDARLELVELSLRKFGFLLPIYATPDGEIVSGHQRHLVAERIGFPAVPVCTLPDLPLHKRKALNITFNRATNDMRRSDTERDLTAALQKRAPELETIRLLRDRPLHDFPCMNTVPVRTRYAALSNPRRTDAYASKVNSILREAGAWRPVVLSEGGTLVNGAGWLQAALERGDETVDAVTLPSYIADLAEILLNLLSMDFDIHTRYADLLRANGFTAQRRRSTLGRCFLFPLIGQQPAHAFNIARPEVAKKWKAYFGERVLDFGAGHLYDTRFLCEAGVDCVPFEPYAELDRKTGMVDVERSRELVRRFLAQVASGRPFSSIFMASVLNTVPFKEDRRHLVLLAASLCKPKTRVFAAAASTRQATARSARGKEFLNFRDRGVTAFPLTYEPNTIVSNQGGYPTVQHYHTAAEWEALWLERFKRVVVSESMCALEVIASDPKPFSSGDLDAAIRFEFNLPYTDGRRMNLVEEAREAWSQGGYW